MNAIKHVRDKLFFSQEEMALCLGVSRSLVALCETGRKELPTQALIRLSSLENMITESRQKREAQASAEEKLVSDYYERSRTNPDPKLRLHASRTAKLHRQLLEIKEKYITLKNQMELIKGLSGKTAKDRTKENVFLDMLEVRLAERFSNVSTTKQLMLRAKVMGRIREYEVLNGEI